MGQSQGKMEGASELRESAAAHHKKISRATDHLLRLREPEPYPHDCAARNMAADKDNVYTLKNSIDEAVRAKAGEPIAVDEKAAAGEATHSGSGDNLDSAVVGILAASSAVTMLAAGAVSPPLAFVLFVVLLGGLTLAVSSVRGA